MPDIFASQPVVIPPQPEVVFDRWVIQRVEINWRSPESPMPMEVIFRSARRDSSQNDKLVLGPEVRRFSIDDLWALAASDAGAANAIGTFVGEVTKIATERGAI